MICDPVEGGVELSGAALWDVGGLPLAFDPSVAGAKVAKGHTVVDSAFNGATLVQVLNGAPTNSSIVGSP